MAHKFAYTVSSSNESNTKNNDSYGEPNDGELFIVNSKLLQIVTLLVTDSSVQYLLPKPASPSSSPESSCSSSSFSLQDDLTASARKKAAILAILPSMSGP